MDGKVRHVRFATGQNLEQARAFFAASGVGSSRVPAASVPERLEGAAWELIEEWDASHRVPRRGDGKRINTPSLVEWSPDGEMLVTACDAFGLTRWYSDGRRVGGGTPPYAYGDPRRFFWSPDGGLVLLEAQTALNIWWSIQSADGRIVRQVVANGFWLWGSDSLNHYGLHRTRCFNPWRPGASQLLIVSYDAPQLDLIDVSALPERETTDLPVLLAHAVGLARLVAKSLSGAGDEPEGLAATPPTKSVSLAPLGAQDRRIMRFAWHPSGRYVAVTTGHSEDKGMRRVHVLDYESAEIVASLPPSTTGVGWSPGGRLLFCQQWTGAYTSDWKIETLVWDSHEWSLRGLTEDERRQPWARHYEFTGLGVRNDALNADGTLRARLETGVTVCANDGGGHEEATRVPLEGQVDYLAWSPTDPRRLATVGGDDAPHSLRIWRLKDV